MKFTDDTVDKVPERFKRGEIPRDIFMESMYKTYSKPLLDSAGKPINGRFVMYKDRIYAAAQEVLQTHLGLRGNELKAYLDKYFEIAWRHFDLTQVGWLDCERMPVFMRYLA